jgi:hypothetical protein
VAKPNHGFFHCQHPARKKIARHGEKARRRCCRGCRCRHAGTHARKPLPSACRKQNIFFSAVFFLPAFARQHQAGARGQRRAAFRLHLQAGERIVFDLCSQVRISAPQPPDCAKVRELPDAFRGSRDAIRMRRCSKDDVGSDLSHRVRECRTSTPATCAGGGILAVATSTTLRSVDIKLMTTAKKAARGMRAALG